MGFNVVVPDEVPPGVVVIVPDEVPPGVVVTVPDEVPPGVVVIVPDEVPPGVTVVCPHAKVENPIKIVNKKFLTSLETFAELVYKIVCILNGHLYK